MAKNSALPLLLGAGALLLLMGGGKKSSGGVAAQPISPKSRDPKDIKPTKVTKDKLTVDSGSSLTPDLVKLFPFEPFESIEQIQEALIVAGYPLEEYGADADWGNESKNAMADFMAEHGYIDYPPVYTDPTPGVLRRLWRVAKERQTQGAAADPQSSAGTNLWCDITQLDCKRDHECIPIYGPGEAPAGYDDLGICIPKEYIEQSVAPPGPQQYAPGGFDEVYITPDYSGIKIGGGWRFAVLEPFLEILRGDGRLLTAKIEGWGWLEEYLVKAPSESYRGMMSELGLGLAASGASSMALHDLLKAYTKEVPITKPEFSHYTWHQDWYGPKGMLDPATGRLTELGMDPRILNDALEENVFMRAIEHDEARGFAHYQEPSIEKGNWFHGRPHDMFVEEVPTHLAGKKPSELPDYHFGMDSVDALENVPPGKKLYRVIYVAGVDWDHQPVRSTIHVYAENLDAAGGHALDWADEAFPRTHRLIERLSGDRKVVSTVTVDVDTGARQIVFARPELETLKKTFKNLGIKTAAIAATVGFFWGTKEIIEHFSEKERAAMTDSALKAIKLFNDSATVRVGNQQMRIADLPEGSVASRILNEYIAESVARFQTSYYGD